MWFHYQNDDVWGFGLAHSDGLSWKLITVNGFEHFAPLERVEHWLLLTISPFNVDLGIGAVMLVGAALLLSVAWLTAELGISPRRRVLVLIVGGLAMPILSVASWCARAVYIIPTMAATYAVLAAHARGVRQRSTKYHTLACLFLLIAVGMQERGSIAVILVILMDVFVLARGAAWSERLHRLFRARGPLLVLVAIAATDALIWWIWYRSAQATVSFKTGSEVIGLAFSRYLLPALVGSHDPLNGPLLWIVGAIVLGGVVTLFRRDRSTLDLLAFFCCTFLLYYFGLAFGPLLVNGVTANASQPQYLAYVIFPLIITVALVPARVLAHRPAPRGDRAHPWTQTVLVAAVVAGFSSCKIFTRTVGISRTRLRRETF